MAKERYRITSECPECGCGLVDNMTPDEFRKKQGDIKETKTGNSREDGKDRDVSASGKHAVVQK